MILYRSIGIEEFKKLINGDNIEGRYDLSKERQSTSNLKNVICFFTDEYWWLDKSHTICIKLDIPENRLQFGIGTYYAPKILAKTRVWSGRRGTEKYNLGEAYSLKYNIQDVIAVSLGEIQNKHRIENYLRKKNIVLFDIKSRHNNVSRNSVKIKVKYYFRYNISNLAEFVVTKLKKNLQGYTDYIEVNCLNNTRIDFNLNIEKLKNFRNVIMISGDVIQYNLIDKGNSLNCNAYNITKEDFEKFLTNKILN